MSLIGLGRDGVGIDEVTTSFPEVVVSGEQSLKSLHRVEFMDTDASGRAHFTAAFRWAEKAEHSLLTQLGVGDVSHLPRVSVCATYFAALTYGTHFVLKLSILRIGRTSLTLGWSASNSDATYFEGEHTIVSVGESGQPVALPRELVTRLAALRNHLHQGQAR